MNLQIRIKKTQLHSFISCSGIVGVVAASEDVIGYDDQLGHPSWCWIDPGRSDVLFWQYFTDKAWEIVSYIMTAVLYTLIKLFLMKQVIIYN